MTDTKTVTAQAFENGKRFIIRLEEFCKATREDILSIVDSAPELADKMELLLLLEEWYDQRHK